MSAITQGAGGGRRHELTAIYPVPAACYLNFFHISFNQNVIGYTKHHASSTSSVFHFLSGRHSNVPILRTGAHTCGGCKNNHVGKACDWFPSLSSVGRESPINYDGRTRQSVTQGSRCRRQVVGPGRAGSTYVAYVRRENGGGVGGSWEVNERNAVGRRN